MHLRRLCVLLGLFAAFASGAAVVYKWTDSDGVVHFSDQPVPGAERIVTSSGTTSGVGGPARASSGAVPNKAPPTALASAVFTIESPAPEQSFFGDEIVAVRLHAEPALKPTQAIAWHLNGKQLDSPGTDSLSFTLQTLPRGTYVLAATVTDTESGDSKSTDSVTFYVRQPSELDLQHHKS
jgi:hypothetical protein